MGRRRRIRLLRNKWVRETCFACVNEKTKHTVSIKKRLLKRLKIKVLRRNAFPFTNYKYLDAFYSSMFSNPDKITVICAYDDYESETSNNVHTFSHRFWQQLGLPFLVGPLFITQMENKLTIWQCFELLNQTFSYSNILFIVQNRQFFSYQAFIEYELLRVRAEETLNKHLKNLLSELLVTIDNQMHVIKIINRNNSFILKIQIEDQLLNSICAK